MTENMIFVFLSMADKNRSFLNIPEIKQANNHTLVYAKLQELLG
jgi:hypothetical protein